MTVDTRLLVLIADDEMMQRLPMRAVLERNNFRVVEAEDGISALEIFNRLAPALVILDVVMPGMDGFEVCEYIRTEISDPFLPILMLTGLHDVVSIERAFQVGATDFLTKPVQWSLLGHKINYLLRSSQTAQALAKSENELLNSRKEIIRRLSMAAEFRDNDTGNHIVRMSHYVFELAKTLGLSASQCSLIHDAAPMHDVGKIGISDDILLKPGKLTANEFEIMKRHTLIGHQILSGNQSPLLQCAQTIALTHHEKWDGSGYPNGLRGEDIPLFGRICAVADVFDALTSYRPYKSIWDEEAAAAEIRRLSGHHFEPKLVEVFSDCLPEIIAIKNAYIDV